MDQGDRLSRRLSDHRKNIGKATTTLRLDDFDCRTLVVQSGMADIHRGLSHSSVQARRSAPPRHRPRLCADRARGSALAPRSPGGPPVLISTMMASRATGTVMVRMSFFGVTSGRIPSSGSRPAELVLGLGCRRARRRHARPSSSRTFRPGVLRGRTPRCRSARRRL